MSSRASSTSTKTELPGDNAAHDDVEREAQRPEPPKEKDQYLVDWAENDQYNPRNWSNGYKAWITFQLSMLALAASLGSSIIAPAEDAIANYTGVSREVTVLSISLYVLGFAFGPLCWAPVSEQWGRRWSLLPAMFCLGLFSIGTATSSNITSILVTRFFGGLFGSAPVSNVAAALGDMYAPRARGTAVTFYAVAVVGGPTLGPTLGAALTVNKHLGWRWTEYIEAIWVFASFALSLVAMPELYAPVLLHRKAIKMRKETGDERYHHPHEDVKLDFNSVITKHLIRPLRMLFTEPMVSCIAVYASFVFGLLYLTLEVFPIVFQEIRGYGLVVSTLPFLALFVGVLAAVGVNLANQPRYIKLVNKNGGKPVPEGRLLPMLFGGIIFAVGLFWFGWTAAPRYHWILPTIGAAFIGAGFSILFQQCINYLVDTYQVYAASATAANTILRSLLASAFPLVAAPMFHNLGVGPAMSILGGLACLMLPAPLIFMRYGLTLRKMSKFAPVED